jgi:peptidoglycan hydrolase-like protein with peptidoglycan-binding domain
MPMQKYFEILELDMSASIEEVEQAYKELTQAWRPQSYQNLPRFKRKAEIKLKEINEAYERVRSYLLAKQPAEHHGDHLAVAEKLSESRKESKPDRKTPRPQFRKPANRSLLYGFIAIAAVLGALLLYQISNHPEHRQAAPEREKPALQTASPQSSANHPEKESDSGPAGASVAAKTPPAGKSAETAAPVPASTDKAKKPLKKMTADNAPLKHSVLDRINRDPDRVKRIQKSLIANGYDTGPLDGIIGPQTLAALKQFAGDRAIEADSLFADDLTGAVLVYAEIAATHPDAPQIIRSNDFALWLDSQTHFQTSAIQKLKKSPTARQIIEILDRYKSDKKMS